METQTTSKSNVMEETIPINITKEEIDAFLQVMVNFIHSPRIESFRKKVEIAKTMNYSAYYHTPELLMQKIYEVTGITKMEFQGISRKRKIVDLRSAASRILKEYFPELSLGSIGNMQGARMSSTITNQIWNSKNCKDTIRVYEDLKLKLGIYK